MDVSIIEALERLRREQAPAPAHVPNPSIPPTELDQSPRFPTPPDDEEDDEERGAWTWDMGSAR